MKNKLTLFVALVVLSASTHACTFTNFNKGVEGSGNVKTEIRNVSGFTEVRTTSSVDIKVKQSSTFEVKVEADDNLLQYITTEIDGNCLVVSIENGINIRNSRKMVVYVSMPQLNGAEVKGSGNILGDSKFSGDKIDISIYGSGNISLSYDGKNGNMKTAGSGNIDINGKIDNVEIIVQGSGNNNATLESSSIEITIKGSGDVKINGNTSDFKAMVQGSGDIDCFDLNSKTADVTIKGSGNCNITVSELLNASIYGSGDIYYKGNPDKIKSDINGSGKVKNK